MGSNHLHQHNSNSLRSIPYRLTMDTLKQHQFQWSNNQHQRPLLSVTKTILQHRIFAETSLLITKLQPSILLPRYNRWLAKVLLGNRYALHCFLTELACHFGDGMIDPLVVFG